MPEDSDSSLLVLPVSHDPSLSVVDQQTFGMMQRWKDGESLITLGAELGITKEGLRKRIKSCAYRYSGTTQAYTDLVEEVILNKMIDAEDELEGAQDAVAATRAREGLKHSQWLAERRLPKKFAPKQEISTDKTVHVHVHRSPQQIVVEGQMIEADSQVIEKTED